MDEDIQFFLVEGYEELSKYEQNLLKLEENPTNKELIQSIFRSIHSIKGTCGFLGFVKLQSIAHAGENLLSALRDGKVYINSKLITILLELTNVIKEIMKVIETTEQEGGKDYSEFKNKLEKFLQDELQNSTNLKIDLHVNIKQSEQVTQEVIDSMIRVDIKLLDKLMNLVGELVLNRNQILQTSSRMKDLQLQTNTQKLNQITTELQEGIMKTRMQPIRVIWEKFYRVVRDLSLELGKKVKLECIGEETEMDKSIIESIKDPLMHIIRNCVDHGIESINDRKAQGKIEEGTIQLKAYHEGGQVNIQISDDGQGINTQKVLQKAISSGMIAIEQVGNLNETEIINLIMLPGFSTAEKVTNISGRGVGMDVVKSNIEKIGGTIHIVNNPTKGILFRITIPLTLTIIPSLIVSNEEYKFAIPQTSLLEIVELDEKMAKEKIKQIHNSYIFHLREEVLAVVFLKDLLNLKSTSQKRINKNVYYTIVVVQTENHKYGIILDEALDTEEIVVKPLGKHVQDIFAFSGVTILGDGKIALILNIQGISEVILNNIKDVYKKKTVQQSNLETEKTSYILFEILNKYKLALPLDYVLRIEEIPRDQIKYSAGKKVYNYLGKFIPLIPLTQILFNQIPQDRQILHTIIYQVNDYTLGLIVDDILDIIDGKFELIQKDPNWKDMVLERDIFGSIVYEKETIDVLDMDALIRGYKNLVSNEILSMVQSL